LRIDVQKGRGREGGRDDGGWEEEGAMGGGRRRKVCSGANAVNEEDPERDRAT